MKEHSLVRKLEIIRGGLKEPPRTNKGFDVQLRLMEKEAKIEMQLNLESKILFVEREV